MHAFVSLVLVLLNGMREELWFRGLFLQRYGQFLGPWASNLLTAVIFTSFHVCGYLMQRSGSLIGPVLFHAGSDIPILLAYLSYVST